ncbi:hypothetical protein ACSBR2_037459 [Camellia fascicularis]
MMRKSNIMAYAIEVPGEGNLISTPPTSGTILPGITRKTVINIAPVIMGSRDQED